MKINENHRQSVKLMFFHKIGTVFENPDPPEASDTANGEYFRKIGVVFLNFDPPEATDTPRHLFLSRIDSKIDFRG